jgi:alpha-galactosidase
MTATSEIKCWVLIIAGILILMTSAIPVWGSEVYPADPRPVIAMPQTGGPPRIQGPRLYGARPGNPFMYYVPTVGERPIRFSAVGLPPGLKIDAERGLITGRAEKEGDYSVSIQAQNSHGKDSFTLTVAIGPTLCLTPPLGWNSWNSSGFYVKKYDKVTTDDAYIRSMADLFVEKGLINYGWTYINIDEGWQGERSNTTGTIQPNDRFPDMKALCDYVHAHGLKIGIYSSPHQRAPGNAVGQRGERDGEPYSFDLEDARQWAEWGFDFLKHDGRPVTFEKFKPMSDALLQVPRDIVYSMSNTTKPGPEWRTIANLSRIGRDHNPGNYWGRRGEALFNRAHAMTQWEAEWVGRGFWADPDMLTVGTHRKNYSEDLARDEDLTHMTLWVMAAAPLILGCKREDFDDFQVALLSNAEVLAVNQDPLGRIASCVNGQMEDGGVWAKPLEDGSLAVALYNRSDEIAVVRAEWKDLGLEGPRQVRDLWKHVDVGIRDQAFAAEVRPRGVVLVRMSKP